MKIHREHPELFESEIDVVYEALKLLRSVLDPKTPVEKWMGPMLERARQADTLPDREEPRSGRAGRAREKS